MRHFRPFLAATLAIAALAAPIAAASAATVTPAALATAPALTTDDADTLAPGQWVWRPDLSPEGEVRIAVDLERQVAFVYRGETLIGLTSVSTGRDGYPTPIGVFPILQKQVEHRSTLYNDAPMPYMQRLTWDGVALHAGSVPGYRSSHGCVHLPDAFAKLLYSATQLGAVVEIDDPAALTAPAAEPLAPAVTASAKAADTATPVLASADAVPAAQ